MNLNLPTIENFSRMTKQDVEAIAQYGFCYVKVPNEQIPSSIQALKTIARNFFNQPSEEKNKLSVEAMIKSKNTECGYLTIAEQKHVKSMELFYFTADDVCGPFENQKQSFKHYINVTWNKSQNRSSLKYLNTLMLIKAS